VLRQDNTQIATEEVGCGCLLVHIFAQDEFLSTAIAFLSLDGEGGALFQLKQLLNLAALL
jgi:hypothetical protein